MEQTLNPEMVDESVPEAKRQRIDNQDQANAHLFQSIVANTVGLQLKKFCDDVSQKIDNKETSEMQNLRDQLQEATKELKEIKAENLVIKNQKANLELDNELLKDEVMHRDQECSSNEALIRHLQKQNIQSRHAFDFD